MKASRVGALCLVAGSLAGLTGERVLALTPAELQKEIDDLRHLQSVLSKPGIVLTSTPGGLRTFDRDDFSQLMGALVSRGELSPTHVQKLVFASVAMTKIARDLVAKELVEKEQALARLDSGVLAGWVAYEGTLTGTFKADCTTATGSAPQSGTATFKLENSGGVASQFQGWGVGKIELDGTASGWATIVKLDAHWFGRFRRDRGTISGKGIISKREGAEYGCTGTWSVP